MGDVCAQSMRERGDLTFFPHNSLIDLAKLIAAVGLSGYAYLLYRAFRGGLMARPYFVLVLSGLILAAAELAELLRLDLLHDLAELVFVIVLLGAFVSAYRRWKRFG